MTASPAGFVLSNAYTVLPSRSPALQKRVVIVSPGSTGFENRTASRFSNAPHTVANAALTIKAALEECTDRNCIDARVALSSS